MKKYGKFNITLSVLLSGLFVSLGVLCFPTSYLRFAESAVDLWQSCRFYFEKIVGLKPTSLPGVTEYSEVIEWKAILPEDLQSFKRRLGEYCRLLISRENATAYLNAAGSFSERLSKLMLAFLPCILALIFVMKKLYAGGNTHHGRDTACLRAYKAAYTTVIHPIKRCISSFFSYLQEHPWLRTLWLALWVFHLNLASIVVSFFAYYLYFAVSYRFDTLYRQFCKLLIDLQVFFTTVPLWLTTPLAWCVFERFRRSIARQKLRRFEARNCGLINELPIVSMTCGSMGKKKTTILTDMGLSQEVMFRQKAYELLQKNDMRFPNFPWISFELDLKRAMEYHQVYSLATVKAWIEKKRRRYAQNGDPERRLYGYDVTTYGDTYEDGLRVWDLFDVLSIYAQLYFIYVIESSLIVANYSVRTDAQLQSQGNFPLWYNDFFSETSAIKGRHAHILDFDTLRLGKKMVLDNPNIGSFEFGVVLISEVGKERGNVLDHKELRKNNDETNQKNDLFNSWLKMCRHSATVDNFPFIKVFTDEQRPESWGADARDLCDIIHIVSGGPLRTTLPFYTVEEMLTEHVFNRFIHFYYRMRYLRGDHTLLVHFLKAVCGWLYRRNIKLYNRYSYSVAHIEKERGTMDAKIERKKYYVMNQKIYSRRFSTDCFSDYFNDLAKRSKVGLGDYLEYETEKASVEELKMQNSYFINALYKNASSDEGA